MTDDNEYMYAVDHMRGIFVSYTLINWHKQIIGGTTTDVVETIPYWLGYMYIITMQINDNLSVQ